MSNAETIERHLAAFQAGDVERLMADYAEDCTLLIDDQVITGHAALRPFFEHVFTAMFPGGVTVEVESKATSGDVTLLKWSARTPNVVVAMGADTMVLRRGKISVQTVAMKLESPRQDIWP